MASRRQTVGWTGAFVVLAVALPAWLLWPRSQRATADAGVVRVYGSPTGYVGSHECADCHASISTSFHQSQMGRSWAAVADAEPIEQDGEVVDAKLDLHYQVQRRDGRLVVREYRLDEEGNEVHSLEVEAKYAIGSGLHGRSYVAEQHGYLTLLPVGWYSDAGEWRLGPGYEDFNQRFGRPVTAQCVGCHNAEPTYIEGSAHRFQLPLPGGIGCESCHGPGAEHVARQRRDPPRIAPQSEPDPTIVNPARLAPQLQQDVCLQCHLQGDAVVPQPGKGLFDYRPGLRLKDFRSDFFEAEQTGAEPGSVSHVPRSTKSRCFTASGGRLTCVKCHDSHVPLQQVAAGFYNSRCLSCHEERGCSRPLQAAETATSGDCVACHMPRVSSGDIGHAVTTEHWIRRRPEAGVTPVVSKPDDSAPSGLPHGFWGDETDGQIGSGVVMNAGYWDTPELLRRGIRLLEKGLRDEPDAREWQFRLGVGYFHARRWKDAQRTFLDVLRAAPDMTEARELLGRVYIRMEQRELAIQTFEEMLRRNRHFAGADVDLASLYFDLNRSDRLLEMMDDVLREHPPNPLVLSLAAKARLIHMQDAPGALALLQQAQRVNPFVPHAFMLEAQVAMELGDVKRAERALRGAIRAQDGFAHAHMALADLLNRIDRSAEAAQNYERVLELDPGNIAAQRALERLRALETAPP